MLTLFLAALVALLVGSIYAGCKDDEADDCYFDDLPPDQRNV